MLIFWVVWFRLLFKCSLSLPIDILNAYDVSLIKLLIVYTQKVDPSEPHKDLFLSLFSFVARFSSLYNEIGIKHLQCLFDSLDCDMEWSLENFNRAVIPMGQMIKWLWLSWHWNKIWSARLVANVRVSKESNYWEDTISRKDTYCSWSLSFLHFLL